MEKLLHWSVANSQGDKEAAAKIGQPDPKVLQQLFGGGPDEPALMKQAIVVASNPEATLDAKLVALDNFEMLIENLDNANNIENLKLWNPILELISDPEAEIRALALSIVGTAVQNNEKSQNNFLSYEQGLSKIIKIAQDGNEKAAVRAKAFYALSNLVRHNKTSSKKLKALGGLDIITAVLKDESATDKLKLRVLAYLTAIMTANEISESLVIALRTKEIVESTLKYLNAQSSVYVVDRVLNFLSHLISSGVAFTENELTALKAGIADIEQMRERLNEDDYQTVKHVL